ncbi:hypothetical protein [Paenibacillus sp. MMS18-CY102]|uniref:hypothetical protein n=1 Tax=Paenibacillus sp. MMS18-CY102 TaxID=2682849 RepID=UPI001365A19B|nr:hypothetical protein [Paenibacillus sp. MMS18-CY102]MWC29170.1 hypothetical protein [Paenibacillus sp. MMS18-CY102]
MRSKLVLIEGLPGSGKTTTAQLVHDILGEMNITSQLFLEGNLEHPADYDGVAFFNQDECDELWSAHPKFNDYLRNRMIKQGGGYFLEYRKIQDADGPSFPDELIPAILKHDIYELPLDQKRKLITERWKKFADLARNGADAFIFECCFIQNPVTVGMIKHDAKKKDVISYVAELATIVERLNPLLIYVEQNDVEHSFRKAVKERPKEWSEGFVDYYTSQGYGKRQNYTGLEGTLQVLRARRELEEEIFGCLNIAKVKVNNSAYTRSDYKQVLGNILSGYWEE